MENSDSNNSELYKKIPKTKKCILNAVNKYQKNLKEKNIDMYNKRLQYYRDYYMNNNKKLKDAIEMVKMYENMKQISINSN